MRNISMLDLLELLSKKGESSAFLIVFTVFFAGGWLKIEQIWVLTSNNALGSLIFDSLLKSTKSPAKLL